MATHIDTNTWKMDWKRNDDIKIKLLYKR